MKRIETPSALLGKVVYHSDVCDLHPIKRKGELIPQPIQKMIVNGNIVCPRCELERYNTILQEQEMEKFEKAKEHEAYNVLYQKSMIEDETILDAHFETYIAKEPEERANKQLALTFAKRYQEGEIFRLILQGEPGVGKSHLAYSILQEINQGKEHTCLFISFDAMLAQIRDSISNKESKYTESYFKNLLTSVDFLVLDDLGAETGDIDTEKTASDFVKRVLFGIVNGRQSKATIYTTNVNGETLYQLYDRKLVSRMLRTPRESIVFRETKDKRILPF